MRSAMPLSHSAQAYNGYLIRPVGFAADSFMISRDGAHISYAPTLEAARAIIDELTAPWPCPLCGQIIRDGRPCGCGAR
jgi:hypothetical protein